MSPLEIFLSAPPISRSLAALTFTFSLLLYLNFLPWELYILSLHSLTQLPPHIWRIFTSLIITGPGLGILFDTYFLYVYGSKLENASPRFSQRADFVAHICVICTIIVSVNLFITYGSALAPALALAFVTNATRDSWGQPITFIVLKMPAQYLPYAILFLTLIAGSPQQALVQATGLFAVHLYNLLAGLYPNFGIKRNLVTTPAWLKRVCGTQAVVDRPYGTVFMSSGTTAEPAWGLDLSWRKFGPGRTLGEEGSSVESQRPRGCVLAMMVMGVFLLFCIFVGILFVQKGAQDAWFSSIDVSKLAGNTANSKTTS